MANTEGFQVGLYKNNVTPTVGSVLSDFTPADFGGYAGLTSMTGAAVADDGTTATMTWDPVVFTCDGSAAGDVYGYYVRNVTQNYLAWAELDPAGPVNLSVNGQTYTVVPKLTNRNQ